MSITEETTNPQIQGKQALKLIKVLYSELRNPLLRKQLEETTEMLLSSGMPNLSPLLPLLLNLKGRPYTLKDHYPFEPFFNSFMSNNIVLKTGRQVSKSTSLAAQGVVISNCIPHFNTLYITPLYEMVRRFSNNYVRGFIDQSPVRKLWTGTDTSSSVLQRSFVNKSNMFFSFAFMDAERTRGINADKCAYDEVQDLDSSFIPIIRETMSASPWNISQYAGTPKTLDNTLEGLWSQSSMAEWVITCDRCGYENVPSMEHDLDDMIGPWREDISEENPGTLCAKCRRPVNPRYGMWYHNHPDKIGEFSGYHVPQIVMPMHYANPDKWSILVGKREGRFNTPINVFYNEVCGESYDTGSKLVTVTDLKKASCLGPNDIDLAAKKFNSGHYLAKVLAVDWGGGGAKGVSFTTYAVMGIKPSGQIHVLYGYRSLTPHDFDREARLCLRFMAKFDCTHLVHDYTGAGAHREKYVIDAGFPYDNVIPIWYVRAGTQEMMKFVPASDQHPRHHYKVDKARSLVLTCSQIKSGKLMFFDYDYKGEDQSGLLHDFLALVEDKVDSRMGRDIYTIIRQQNMSDDFAQSVNFGCCALWHMTQTFPNIVDIEDYNISSAVLEAMHPENPTWDDVDIQPS